MITLHDPPGFYAREKLTAAVAELKTDRPVKERLGWAMTHLVRLQRKDIPDGGLADELVDIRRGLLLASPWATKAQWSRRSRS